MAYPHIVIDTSSAAWPTPPLAKPSRTRARATPRTITYTGQEQDTSGLLYYSARYDDPALARFIALDTTDTLKVTVTLAEPVISSV